MFVNRETGEINLKIVYYGPALSGKTTNLECIHEHTPPERRGNMVALKTYGDRTLFFDYMQLELPPIKGYQPKFNLYTVPGQVVYAASRKLVLQGADGVVFVADSQIGRMKHNLLSLLDLHQNLKAAGTDAKRVSLVIQFNKRDLSDAAPVAYMRRVMRLGGRTFPVFQSVAIHGYGVLDTLKAAIDGVSSRIRTTGAPG